MQKERQVVSTFLQIVAVGTCSLPMCPRQHRQAFLIETHECCNLKNNVTYVKSHNGVYHIRSVFQSHKNAPKLAGNSVAILLDYFQGGCMLTKIMKTSKIVRLRVDYRYG